MSGEAMQGLQVINIYSENFKRLKVIDISPKDQLTVVSGSNGEGKSSVLDSIWFALDAAGYMKATRTIEPLKQGEKRGVVRLELGKDGVPELHVTRKFSEKGNTLEVMAPNGSVFKSPQTILDALTGAISFDPMSFAMMKPAEQYKQILEVVPLSIDLDAHAAKRQAIYDERTGVNRIRKEKEAIFLSLPIPEEGTPDEELKADDILKKITEAQDTIKKHNAKRQELADARAEAQNLNGLLKLKDEQIKSDRERIEELKLQIQDLESNIEFVGKEKSILESEIKEKTSAGQKLAAVVDALKDPELDGFNEELRTLEETNRKIRAKKDRLKAKADFEKLDREALALTDKIEALDNEKADAIKAAKFPVEGLGFGDDGITFNGVPFTQASSAQRLRVSLAIAIALNPRLRVLRITDGSLLDSKSMTIIREMCADQGYQVWMERVDESGAVGIVIEDGEVKAVN